MKNIRLVVVIVIVLSTSLFFLNENCMAKKFNPKGQVYYTRVNLWNSKVISTWCSHKGYILPMGTKVTITKFSNSMIRFDTEEGYSMRIKKSRHTAARMSDLFDLYFSKDDPKSEGGDYHKLSKFEKENIDVSAVVPGMSKKAVVMSYGYPPDKTGAAPLSAPKWTYWGSSRFEARIYVYFRNNAVYKVEKLVKRGGGPFGIGSGSRIEVVASTDYDLPDLNGTTGANPKGLAAELQEISKLHKTGQLTDEEFRRAKEKILNR